MDIYLARKEKSVKHRFSEEEEEEIIGKANINISFGPHCKST